MGNEREIDMTDQLKSAFAQSRDTLLRDALGLASILVFFFVGLSLPGLV